jgi:hypothetical protein
MARERSDRGNLMPRDRHVGLLPPRDNAKWRSCDKHKVSEIIFRFLKNDL